MKAKIESGMLYLEAESKDEFEQLISWQDKMYDEFNKMSDFMAYVEPFDEVKKILIIDIETTNFLQRHGKIVEVGIVELNLMNGKRKILFDEVCQEDGITKEEIESAWIVSNSDLTLEAIQKSRNFTEMQQEIQNIIDSYPLGSTAFNNKFDFDFLEDRGIVIANKLPCPMKLSTDICRIPAKSGFGFKWPKVQEAYDFFFKDNDYVEKHRGADDAYHEAEIVYKLYKMGEFPIN